MFRFEEDAFLRKGGDVSRNCLTFEEEEEEAVKFEEHRIASPLYIPPNPPKPSEILVVGAAGKATEALLRALFAGTGGSFVSKEFGEGYTKDDKLVGFQCLSTRRAAKEPSFVAALQEHAVGEWLAHCCTKQSLIVVLATTPLRDQPNDYEMRKLYNGYVKGDLGDKSIRQLELGRLVSSYAAAVMEAATFAKVPAVCYLSPRESILARETLESFASLVSALPALSGSGASPNLSSMRNQWMKTALVEDEKDQRRFEPAGMYM